MDKEIMKEHIKESLRKVMDFLEENEQYGDDWGPELTILNLLFDQADGKKKVLW